MKQAKLNGIVFDMDNTILHSHIDFAKMKQTTCDTLALNGCLPANWASLPTGQLIGEAAKLSGFSSVLAAELWQQVGQIEAAGMVNAVAAPGILELLPKLKVSYFLAVLTNNCRQAAAAALNSSGLAAYFDLVVTRNEAPELKPLSGGLAYVLGVAPQVKNWLTIGDAWIDAKAAEALNLTFWAYTGQRQETWPQATFCFDRWQNALLFQIDQFFALDN